MDRLTEEQRAIAWEVSWHPSFEGTAIINKDFTFHSVNPQFCAIVGASPAELIGKRFQDITPPPIKEIDENNAKLVMAGIIESYLLNKTYEFSSGSTVSVVLLVRGAYSAEKEFLFFVSKIMLDTEKQVSHTLNPEPQSLTDFVTSKSKAIAVIGTVIAATIAGVIKALGV